MRRRRFVWVFARAALFFGILLGAVAGGLTASVLERLLPAAGLRAWPLGALIPMLVVGTGLPIGLLVAYADLQITSRTPEERLDPVGAVRQRITLETLAPVDATLEAVSRIAFEDLGWTIEARAEGHVTLRTPPSFGSFGERIEVDLHPTPAGTAVLIDSRPLSFLSVLDYNKNRENALGLRGLVRDRLGSPGPEPS